MLIYNNSKFEGIRLGCATPTTGTAIKLSTTNSKFGGSSAYNNGTSGSWISMNPASVFAFGTSNFTIEFWVNPAVLSIQGYFGTRPASTNGAYISVSMNASGTFNYYINNAYKLVSTASVTANVWSSVALVRNSGTTTFYINGTAAGSVADTISILSSRPTILTDDYNNGGLPTNGYTDEFRISNIARYTGNYTPATQPFTDDINTVFLMHFDGPNNSLTFVDDNT
jgi:hypothetical protein